MTGIFADYAKFYDALYSDKDYAAEAAYFDSVIRRFSPGGASKLFEFGAGSGKHQIEFQKLGYSVGGADLSPEMCDQAAKNGANVIEGDIRIFSPEEEQHVVLALFHVVSYLTSEHDIGLAFSNIRNTLVPGGLFVFDIWYKDAVSEIGPGVRVKRVKLDNLEILRLAEPVSGKNEEIKAVDYSIFARQKGSEMWEMITERHNLKPFSLDEIRSMGKKAGLDFLHAEESLTGERPGKSTWSITIAMRRGNA